MRCRDKHHVWCKTIDFGAEVAKFRMRRTAAGDSRSRMRQTLCYWEGLESLETKALRLKG